MADVRSLLRNERNARRISHPHVTYSTAGTLLCLVCHIQLKSESLWSSHLRSAQHAERLQHIREGTLGRPPGATSAEAHHTVEAKQDEEHDSEHIEAAVIPKNSVSTEKNNKRKADDDEETARKKSRPAGLPAGFFDGGVPDDISSPLKTSPPLPGQEFQIASRPATPLKTPELITASKAAVAAAVVDEEEWAAFEAEMATVDTAPAEESVISAPAMTVAEVAAKSKEEESAQRKERQEAEMEGDKEDVARKLQDEFEDMEALEMRVKRLKEKREALRLGGKGASGGERIITPLISEVPSPTPNSFTADRRAEEVREENEEEEEDEDEDEDDDGWLGLRFKT